MGCPYVIGLGSIRVSIGSVPVFTFVVGFFWRKGYGDGESGGMGLWFMVVGEEGRE